MPFPEKVDFIGKINSQKSTLFWSVPTLLDF